MQVVVASEPDLPLIVPSEFYSAIAAGRPVILVGLRGNDGDGESAREVDRGMCGVTVAPDDAVALANAVERLCDDAAACTRMGVMDTNARAMFEADVRGRDCARDGDEPVARGVG